MPNERHERGHGLNGAVLSLQMFLKELPLAPVDVLSIQPYVHRSILPVVPFMLDQACMLDPQTTVFAFGPSIEHKDTLEIRGFLAAGSTYHVAEAPPTGWQHYTDLLSRYPLLERLHAAIAEPMVCIVDRTDGRRVWVARRKYVTLNRNILLRELEQVRVFYNTLMSANGHGPSTGS